MAEKSVVLPMVHHKAYIHRQTPRRYVGGRGGVLLAAALLCLALIPQWMRAQGSPGETPGPSAADILKHTASAYQALKSYQAQITIQNVEGVNVGERHVTETASGASFRTEDADPQGIVRVSDGRNEWTLDRSTNQYAKTSVDTPSWIGQFAHIDDSVKQADAAGSEVYTVSGAPVDVYVVEVSRNSWPVGSPAGAQSVTYTIDKRTWVVYKAVTYTTGPTQIVLYSLTQRDQAVAPTVFAFSPPAGAREVSAVAERPVALKSMLGAEAPDFTLKDPMGKAYSLHDDRGKVVVVDFVGSWCPNCLAQLPYLQQIYSAYPEKDLEAYGLDVGESAKELNEFQFDSAYSFPLLLNVEPDVTAKYFVDDYPTVFIIGRDGHILFRATGMDDPGAFLAAVKSAVAKKN